MKNLKEHRYSITCDTVQELIDCAIYLNKIGETVFNWDDINKIYVDMGVFSPMEWMGLTPLGKNWIRFGKTGVDQHLVNFVKFKEIIRKEKLEKLKKHIK